MLPYKLLVKKLTIELDINESKLADRLNITQATLSERKKKNATKFDDVIELCIKENIDMNELFRDDYHLQQGVTSATHTDSHGMADITFAYNTYKIPVEYIPIMLRFSIKPYPLEYKITKIETDSMSPLINKYNSVIIASLDNTPYSISDGELICFKYKNDKEFLYRIMYKQPDGTLFLTSPNDLVPKHIVTLDDIEIIGIVTVVIKSINLKK